MELEFKSNNTIIVDGISAAFDFNIFDPFGAHQSYSHLLTEVIDYIYNPKVNIVRLSGYPIPLFQEKNLSYDQSAIIYNILEHHCYEADRAVHNGTKEKAFESFLKGCITLISNLHPLRAGMEEVNQLYSYSKTHFQEIKNEVSDGQNPNYDIKSNSQGDGYPTTFKGKKIGEKYFALYHTILIAIGKANHFDRDENDLLPKSRIIAYANNKYGITGNVFYNVFKDIEYTNKLAISKSFGKGFKEVITHISSNDSDIISELKQFSN